MLSSTQPNGTNLPPPVLHSINAKDPHIGLVPPQAIDLEEVVLGALMLDVSAYPTIQTFMHPDVFHKT